MKRLLLILFSLLVANTLTARDISGSWEGILYVGTKLRVVFNIQKTTTEYSATLDIPDQGARGIPVSECSFDGDLLYMRIDFLEAEYSGVLQQNTLFEGTLKQMGHELPLTLVLKGDIAEVKRPQEPIEPYPYVSEEVQIYNRNAGIVLGGTLTYPEDGENLVAAILITGSGAQNRDEEIMGHKPFLVISDHLTKKGVAVLRLDERGIGESDGDVKSSTSEDFMSDIQAAFDYLSVRKEIDKTKIGLIGHSEGGTIAFMLAAKNRDVAYIVSMAGTAIRGDTVLKKQREMLAEAAGVGKEKYDANEAMVELMTTIVAENSSEEIEENIDDFVKQLLPDDLYSSEPAKRMVANELLRMSSPWMRYFMSYDPSESLRSIKCPVFAINGRKDLQVEGVSNLERVFSTLTNNGNYGVRIKNYSGLNHLFQNATTGLPIEYATIEETIEPMVLEDISGWILQVMSEK